MASGTSAMNDPSLAVAERSAKHLNILQRILNAFLLQLRE